VWKPQSNFSNWQQFRDHLCFSFSLKNDFLYSQNLLCSCTSLIKYFSSTWYTFTFAPHFTKCTWASSPHTNTTFTANNWFQFTKIIYIFTIWWLDTDVSPKATYTSGQCWTCIQPQ
jgi:hypothetical protein